MIRIVDASVALKWVREETGTGLSLLVLEEVLAQPESFAVPELFFYEVANVLGILCIRKRLLPEAELEDRMRFFHDLGMARFPMTREMLKDVHAGQSLGLTAYDASYWALARLLRGTWLTFDRNACSAVEAQDPERVKLLA